MKFSTCPESKKQNLERSSLCDIFLFILANILDRNEKPHSIAPIYSVSFHSVGLSQTC